MRREIGHKAPLTSYRHFETVLAVSQAVADVVGPRARVVHLGTRVPHAAPRRGPIVVGAAGRLVHDKGYDHLLHACAPFLSQHPDASLEIAGDGWERAALEHEARQLGIACRVRFLGWQADMTTVYARWHVFVQPSLHEGFGLAALEAMSAGLPVIASATGGLKELVVDGVTGILVPPEDGDGDALARALTTLARSPELRHACGNAGHARAERSFSPEAMAAKIFDIYDELLCFPHCRADDTPSSACASNA